MDFMVSWFRIWGVLIRRQEYSLALSLRNICGARLSAPVIFDWIVTGVQGVIYRSLGSKAAVRVQLWL